MDADTSGEWYTDRLQRITGRGWKRFVPDPYRWNLRRLKLGRTLDVGCGIGRCLAFIDGNGVGVDHNEKSVEETRVDSEELVGRIRLEPTRAADFN